MGSGIYFIGPANTGGAKSVPRLPLYTNERAEEGLQYRLQLTEPTSSKRQDQAEGWSEGRSSSWITGSSSSSSCSSIYPTLPSCHTRILPPSFQILLYNLENNTLKGC